MAFGRVPSNEELDVDTFIPRIGIQCADRRSQSFSTASFQIGVAPTENAYVRIINQFLTLELGMFRLTGECKWRGEDI